MLYSKATMIGAGRIFFALLLASPLLLGGCASLRPHDPLEVTVAGIDPLPGEGMELRLKVKLRVQNPNESAVAFDGVSLTMEVQGKTFASGVSDVKGSVPRFGEAVIEVPVTISALRMVRQAIGIMSGGAPTTIEYEMAGKLANGTFGSMRFATRGSFEMPKMGRSGE